MKRQIVNILTCIGIFTCSAGLLADDGDHLGQYVRESVEVSDLTEFGTGIPVGGATILIRDFEQREVNATISTDALEPNTAYSIWWVIFNNPEYCSDPCDLNDIPGANPGADPMVRPSVFWGGGFTSDANGHGYVTVRLLPGKTNRELFGGTMDYGLENLRKAHIHIVLRTHGDALAASSAGADDGVAAQIRSASMNCNTDSGMCTNVFASVHIPQ